MNHTQESVERALTHHGVKYVLRDDGKFVIHALDGGYPLLTLREAHVFALGLAEQERRTLRATVGVLTGPHAQALLRASLGTTQDAVLDLTGLTWEAVPSDAGTDARLTATLWIAVGGGSTPHHLEAWQVGETTDGTQVCVDRGMQEDMEAVYEGVHGDGAWATTRINGKRYVVIVTPYCV